MANTAKITDVLLKTLSQFGLDPHEWTLADEGAGFFSTLLLVNKNDPSFRLIGHAGHKGWKRIQVLSI